MIQTFYLGRRVLLEELQAVVEMTEHFGYAHVLLLNNISIIPFYYGISLAKIKKYILKW